ncbi:MAG: 50S ribosomal protein L27 [Candidatus Omnitrophica bacterium]|nr:50S ribosomal protein L27 [Candidatus Omnitrophota bacterium]
MAGDPKKEQTMVGGFSRPKKDKMLKVSCGQFVKTGEILSRGINTYRAGLNVKGINTLYALCCGKVYFTRKKTSGGRMRTFINIQPVS